MSTTTFSVSAVLQKTTISLPLSGWQYRKRRTITGTTAGAQTNYALRFVLYSGSGTDTSTNIYLNSSAKSDFSDIRFTKADGVTLLDYWIESYTSGVSAVVWVEVDSIPASPSTVNIFIYYGNSSASDASNGANTFLMFDGFSGSSIDTTIWTVDSSTGFTVAGGELKGTNTTGRLRSIYTGLAAGQVIETHTRAVTAATSSHLPIASWKTNSDFYGYYWGTPPSNFTFYGDTLVNYYFATNDTDVIFQLVLGTSGANSFIKRNKDTFALIAQHNVTKTITSGSQVILGNRQDGLYTGQAYEAYWDWVRVRPLVSPEPTVNTPTEPLEEGHTIGAVISKTQTKTHNLDSVLIFRRIKTFTIDSFLPPRFRIDAYLQKTPIKTFSLDSRLIFRKEKTYSIDTLLKKTLAKTFSISARAYASSRWLTPWKYRKNIIVCGSVDGTKTNYVMRIVINKGVGTDSGNNIYCNNRCNNDFSDIRFTKQDGKTQLSYSVASYISGVSAEVLVKIDYIPADPNSTNIYIYYGNSSATTTGVVTSALLTPFESNHVNVRHTLSLESDWETANHNDGLWDIGNTPFHSDDFGVPNCPSNMLYTDTNYTDFPYSAHVYIRKEFYSDNSITPDLKLGIDNNTTGYLNGVSVGSKSNSGCATYWSHTISAISILKGRNVIAWDISGDTQTNAFDFIFSSLTGLSYRNQTQNEPTFCTFGAEEQYNKGRNMMRTHRVGLRIYNG